MDEFHSEGKYVDAIENGKIVRVSEIYAKREGLMILRSKKEEIEERRVNAKKNADEERKLLIDDYRRPLKWKENQVVRELMENFHWEISKARKAKNMTRKQLADSIGENENTVKMIENGILPRDDFVLINKLQNTLGINLRKDGQNFGQSARAMVSPKPIEKKEDIEIEGEKSSGNDIEIIEED